MAEPLLQLNEFFVEGENQEVSHVLLHITEPSNAEEKQKGYFFAVCEINGATESYLASIQEAIDEIEKGYYELSEEGGKNALEQILEKINERSPALLNGQTKLNCVVGALRQPDIIFATSGEPTLLLFYKTRQALYKSMELGGQSAEAATNANGEPQLFSQIVQGKVSPEDYLFVATPHVRQFFTPDRLEKIITTRPPRQSAEHLERTLRGLPNGYSFGGLIIHVAEAGAALIKKPRPSSSRGSEQSLQNLFTTETSTSETLSPSIFGKVKEGVRSQMNRPSAAVSPVLSAPPQPKPEINAPHLHQYRRSADVHTNRSAALRTLATGAANAVRLFASAVVALARVIFLFFWRIIHTIGLLGIAATNFRGRRAVIIEDWRREWRFYRRTVVELPLITKIIILGTVVVATVFAGSLWYLRMSQHAAADQRAYQSDVQNISTKTDAAESALVYKNEASALSELTEAQKLLLAIPCRTADQKQQCDELAAKINALLARARRITTVTPTVVVSWPAGVTHLIKINTKLVGFGNTTTLYTYELLSGENKNFVGAIPTGPVISGAVPKENDYAVLLLNNSQLLSLNPTDMSTKPLASSFPTEAPRLTSINVYSRRLYTLDASHKQIYKHDATSGGFGPGKPWLHDTTSSIASATDFTIDGDMFVLLQSGSILKFTAGVAAPFTVSALDPALSGTGNIWSYNDLTYLYILDTPNKRLVILTKDGQLKAQLTAAQLSVPSGMAIDEPGKTAYIIDQGSVYKIALPL